VAEGTPRFELYGRVRGRQELPCVIREVGAELEVHPDLFNESGTEVVATLGMSRVTVFDP
jgi:hypothetical protein